MSTSGPGVELAVRLVRQAVHQDSRQNYPEAARCYREAILILQDLKTSRSSTCKQLQNFLDTKLVQYEERLRIIEHHLLSNSDLSKFFKELDSCHFDDCGSSVSSDTKHLYKNPLLIKALDLIRRGRKDDERRDYVAALKSYESGLALLLEVLNKGLLTERQAETARVKCLLYHDRADSIRGFLESGTAGVSEVRGYGSEDCVSLDSDCESPVPVTETDEVLDMMEIRSCSSRLGSTQSLVTTERPVKMSSSRSLVADQMAESLHSLYPVCEIKHSPSVMSVRSTTVPLASISKEISLSELSIASSPSSSSSSRRLSRSVMSNMEKISVLEISNDDTYDPELAELLPGSRCCDDAKSDQGSDSGYSDPSPDGTVRDSKSPSESLDLATDRKSPFSDISERETDGAGSPGRELFKSTSTEEVIPHIIIVNESVQHQGASSLSSPRQMGRQLRQRTQNTRLQNPNKDRIVSELSQDKVSVCDQTDSGWVKPEIRVKHPRKEVKIAAVPDVYSPRVRGPRREYIPPRAVAREPRGEHGDMNKGCYYMMAAMDFCWCL